MHPAYRATFNRPLVTGPLLVEGDFEGTVTAGGTSLPAGWTLTRASALDTVQVSESAIVSGIGADVARGGRLLAADPLALVIEEARTNRLLRSRNLTLAPWGSATFGTATRTQNASNGPDGTLRATRITTAATSWGFPQTPLGNTNPFVISGWGRAFAVSSRWQINYQGAIRWNPVLTTAWERQTYLSTVPEVQLYPVDNSVGDTAGEDFFADYMQCEDGRYATEAIETAGAAVTRAADVLSYTTGAAIVGNDGRVRQYLKFAPKGGSTDFAEDKRLLTFAADGYVEFDFAARTITVVVGGVAYTTAAAMTFAANAVVEVWVAFGGGVATDVQYRVGLAGAWTVLSTGTPTVFGSVAVAGAVDVLGNAGASVFTSRVRRADFYAPGFVPDGM